MSTRPSSSNIYKVMMRPEVKKDAFDYEKEFFMQGAVKAKKLGDLPKADTMRCAEVNRILEKISSKHK